MYVTKIRHHEKYISRYIHNLCTDFKCIHNLNNSFNDYYEVGGMLKKLLKTRNLILKMESNPLYCIL